MTVVIGSSATHHRLIELASATASTDAEVLIMGPSGVGKELYARLIHEQSARARYPLVPVNCGALPLELFENELFGHVGGAFTGARGHSTGLVAEAEHGTLFLDEIDAMHPSNQVKLLRLIQQKEYRPLGDARPRRADVRIIAATNANLLTEVQAGRFRADLFFRLRVLPLRVPSLKERREDIPTLFDHFLQKYSAEYGKAPVRFTARAREHLLAYDWPGNVRELENCARYVLCTYPGATVDVEQLPLLHELAEPVRDVSIPALAPLPEPVEEEPAPSFAHEPLKAAKKRLVSAFERAYIEEKLHEHGGNIAAAARASGKHRRAFFALMRRYGLTASPG
ncbi:sigma-54 interaction domain-containing protein [Pyxidicoccus xibeiensis]|uniref:sigma-54 interaction domain-containing protein n=1 Tax=Pyxidicoccus xibeiensis TaxID=2906759 RepID=UPI0020A7D9B8|nr:sigma 54-interacting transcriptional regulator [Pyxidicoccus xibeiensis]MCP3143402.1 sigma-54 dependent transcriptional regulator [Pyxidicoccus xibeiensis]